jgi:hypothetical protein
MWKSIPTTVSRAHSQPICNHFRAVEDLQNLVAHGTPIFAGRATSRIKLDPAKAGIALGYYVDQAALFSLATAASM